MITDPNMFTVDDVIETLKDPKEITDRIEEALNLIN
jgi:hypothetical protein